MTWSEPGLALQCCPGASQDGTRFKALEQASYLMCWTKAWSMKFSR